MDLKFRKLKADEIEIRAQSVTEKGVILLLYKNSRTDMDILDETVGKNNWRRSHVLINGNLFCNVEIWDADKKEWISKQDVGTESNTEKEKGQASDSFKRACVNWGIGRELYSSPFIFVKAGDCEIADYKSKKTCKDKFSVAKITYKKNGDINGLAIRNTKTKRIVFTKMPEKPEEK